MKPFYCGAYGQFNVKPEIKLVNCHILILTYMLTNYMKVILSKLMEKM